MRVGWIAIVLCITALPLRAGVGADGIDLTVDFAPASGQLGLTWSGSQQPYIVFRSQDPQAVVTAATRVTTTAATSLDVGEGSAPIDYFLVVTVDPNSAVASTSDCLTAGTNARSTVAVDLRDSLGHPLPGSAVIMTTDEGTLGSVMADGGTYRALLEPPAIAAGPATIGLTADGVPLSGTTVTFESPFLAVGGGAGGCPADGNLRVRVVDESGVPLIGARVMVGGSETVGVYQTTPGVAPDGANTGVTDGDGYVEFLDFGANLDGPQTVTAAEAGRRYLTLAGIDAADAVLPLAPIDPIVQAETFTGDVTPVPAPANDPIELAVMLADVALESVLSFSASGLLADNECYNAGGAAGSSPIPGNVYIPSQCAVSFIICLQSLPEHPYTSAAVPFGDRKLLALRGAAPLSALTAGDFNAVLTNLTLNGIGALDATASGAGPTVQDLPIQQGVTPNLNCMIDAAPANSDVFCVSAGDWDSASDPGLTPGAGRLFVTGFRLGDAAGQTTPFAINGATTVARSGAFADIDYLGAAVAQYNDPLKPGIPVGTQDGSSAVLDRSATSFDGTGGTLTFDTFFPIRTLSRAGRNFGLSALPGTPHPAPHLTRVALDRVVTETYTACLAGDSTRVRRSTYWEVFLRGAVDAWQLPTPPPGWPRESVGGDLAGLIDPLATAEDDVLEQAASTLHLGTLPGFVYDRLDIAELRQHLTHVTRNTAPY